MVGGLLALSSFVVWIRLIVQNRNEASQNEEWIDFPELDAMLSKVDREDKDTNIQVSLVCFSLSLSLSRGRTPSI